MSKKIIIGLLLSVLIIGQLTISSEASELGVTMQTTFCEPTVDENSGYVALRQSAGDFVYYWTITPNITTTQNSKMQITLNTSQMVFDAYAVGGSQLSLWAIGLHNGRLYNVCTVTFQDSYHHVEAMNTPTHYTVKGNCSRIVDNVFGQNHPGVAMVWSDNGSDFTKLVEIHNSINGVYNNTADASGKLSTMITQINNLVSEVDNVEETLNAMHSIMSNYFASFDAQMMNIYSQLGNMVKEQQETNTWLEKIFDFLEEKNEKDKQEAVNQGNNSTSQGMDAIDDKGAGFANSLGTLTNSMNYNGTECAWSMPQIKLPAIPGIMDEVVLLESQPIDFSQWVAIIPSNIMLVIQSVLTIGLIVYCFKELYNTIAYVLTLRKDDNS